MEPNLIIIGVPTSEIEQAVEKYGSDRETRLILRLGGCLTTDDLVDRIATQLEFPWQVRGLDAVVSMMAGLDDWIESPAGYFVVANGLDEVSAGIAAEFASIMPNVVDRWRSQAVPFKVMLVGCVNFAVIEASIQEWNARLDEPGPWEITGTHSIPVIRYSGSAS